MSIFKLHSQFNPSGDQPEAIKKLVEGIKNGHQYQTLLGVTGSGKTFTMANVIEHFDMPVLVMAPNKALAAQLYQEYKQFFPENSVNYFVSYYDYYQPEAYIPTSDTYIEKEAMINEEIDRLRHQATSALLTRRDVIVVASVSCIYNLGLPESYFSSALKLAKGQPMTRGDLLRQLVKMQFERTAGVVKRGTFRARGDVFEIMPAGAEVVYRVEASDQIISHLSVTDALTRKIIEETEELIIFPSKHFVSDQPKINAAIKEIKKELKERLEYFRKNNLLLEAERLERRTNYDMQMLKTLGFCHGVENYSRHLSGKLAGEPPETLLSYFPRKPRADAGKNPQAEMVADFLLIMDESHNGVPQVRGMYEGDRSRKETLIQYGWRLPSALDNRPLKFDEFKGRIGQTIFTSATPGDYEMKHSSVVAEQVIRPTGLIDPPIEVRPVFEKQQNRSQIDDVLEEIEKVVLRGERALLITLTKKMAEDLDEFLKQRKIKSNYLHSDVKTIERTEILMDFRRGAFDVLVGVNLLREGLDLPEVTLVAILDADREGFLRSETSLIQTMGRAARNVLGKVILYADNETGSMKRAIEVVNRRRKIQEDYNKKHGITPQSIRKEIHKLLEINNENKE